MKISSWYNCINTVKLVLFLFLISSDRKNNIKHQGKVAIIIIIFLNYNKITKIIIIQTNIQLPQN